MTEIQVWNPSPGSMHSAADKFDNVPVDNTQFQPALGTYMHVLVIAIIDKK